MYAVQLGQLSSVVSLNTPLLNSIILNDPEQLSKIFNDTKRRAVSLRQLSFLFSNPGHRMNEWQTRQPDRIISALAQSLPLLIVMTAVYLCPHSNINCAVYTNCTDISISNYELIIK